MPAAALDRPSRARSPFDLGDDEAYRAWRTARLADAAAADAEPVAIADPSAPPPAEREALLQRLARRNWALYRCAAGDPGTAAIVALGRQLGLQRLDANWLAGGDGISRIAAGGDARADDGRGDYIPYTDRAIGWHTDGYYHPDERRIRAMLLHCVRPARDGGVNALLDHELLYIALRDEDPALVRALMHPAAMTIPERRDADGVARAAQPGPVFSVDARDGALHLRYTARSRSIEWRDDAATRRARERIAALLSGDALPVRRLRMDAGMGLVANNVLHDRSAFADDPAAPRLLYRARYLDRAAAPGRPTVQEDRWRSG